MLVVYDEFIDYTEHPDRETRISVNKSVFTAFMQNQEIYSSALQNICADRLKSSIRRGYNSPLHKSLIRSDIPKKVIDDLTITVEDNIDIYQKFLKIKAKLLNLSKLHGVDVYAYLPSEKKYKVDELKDLILQVYNKFDNSFGEIVLDIFERNHIDLTTREGKIAGFCYPWYNGKSAFVSLSYIGFFRDISPFIHEIGHGIHDCLASSEQSYLNFYPSHLMCETGSIFGELLLMDFFLESTESTQQKIILLTNLLTMGGSKQIFLFGWFFWFEQSLNDANEKGENLDCNAFSKYWCAARDKV
ncbi:MAG: M3 family metallopeptidase [Candidatus Thorarchaeota archaeon]